jgi:NAD-dependent deacetylase
MMKKKLIIFSGAGMSAESGIQTFRDSDGLWEKFRIEDVATPDAWLKDPKMVQDFYNQRRKQILECTPNEAHELIVKLEEHFDVQVITQNIDDLHERAGSKNVMHLHGNIRYSKSSGPAKEKMYYPIEGWELKLSDLCPDGYPLRPHVVWFGEEVPMYDQAIMEMRTCDILIVIGTSLQVYPAAGIIHYAPLHAEKYLIDPNAESLQSGTGFNLINQSATEGMKKVVSILT